MKRRTFLGLAAGTGAAALTVYFTARAVLPVIPKRPEPTAEAAAGWIRHTDGRYVLSLPRAEIGQNIATALKQIACDELGVGWDAVEVELHTTESIAGVQSTVGSESVKLFALPLAQACATLRDALAAGRAAGTLEVEPRPYDSLRAFSGQGRYVGQAAPLVQGPEIVRGDPLYAADMRVEGMVYGRVLRAPATPTLTSRPLSWNAEAARAVPGFIALVEDPLLAQLNGAGLGIVAATPGALDRIGDALDPRWQVEGGLEQEDMDLAVDIDRRLDQGSLAHTIADGAAAAGERWDVDLRIDIPLAAHNSMEPRAAVAAFEETGTLRLWVGSQDAFYVRDVIARSLDLDAARVVVHNCRVGGGFGGRTICTVEQEAAVLARAAGRPVKVQWTRDQELQQGFHRPPCSHRIRARIEGGRLDSWWHAFASSHILFTNAALPPWLQRVSDVIGDFGVARGADAPYRAPNRRIEYDLVKLPVLTGPWRSLGAAPNLMAIEIAVDACAQAAGADPVAFRLAHLEDGRLAGVLRRVAAASGWDTDASPAAPGIRRGRGVACGIYKEMSYAAVVAEVAVDGEGAIAVTRLWCAHDCGRVINPGQVRAQCEGNLVWGLGMVLTDRLDVADGGIDAGNFDGAPIPLFEHVPPMTVELVESDAPPTGAGETAIVAAGAAIVNAVAQATGRRLTRFPVTPEDLAATAA